MSKDLKLITPDMFVPGETVSLQGYKAFYISDKNEVLVTFFASQADFLVLHVETKSDPTMSSVTGSAFKRQFTFFYTQKAALLQHKRDLEARRTVLEHQRESGQKTLDEINQLLGYVKYKLSLEEE